MLKPMIKTTTACLLTISLIGCGEKSQDAVVSEQLGSLLDKMSQLDAAAAPIKGNQLAYTNGTEVEGVSVPGSASYDAAYIDQALALLPEAQAIATAGNPRQKQTANALIASILTDEGAYLIGVSEAGYQETLLDITALRDRVRMLREIAALDQELSGNYDAIIDTLTTGKVTEGKSVQGIEQLETESAAAAEKSKTFQSELAQLGERIEELRSKVAEFESLELKLKNDALSAQGVVRYEKLDQATTAAQKAQTAEAQAESLSRDIAYKTGSATLVENHHKSTEAVIKNLEAKVDQVKSEKQFVADKLAELAKVRQSAIDSMQKAYARLDQKARVLGFDRMAKAQSLLDSASAALSQAGLGRGGELEVMSVYTLRARSLHQQVLAARSYSAALASLAAVGPDVIGESLNSSLTARIAEVQSIEKATVAAAGELEQAAGETVSSVESGYEEGTPEGAVAAEHVKLYRALLGSLR